MVAGIFSPECDFSPGLATFLFNTKNVRVVVPPHTWAEVQHVATDGDQNMAWHYLAFGSAIWLNVGNTNHFDDHPAASKEFLGSVCHDDDDHKTAAVHTECELDFMGWRTAALNRGLDSTQFINHYDCQCGETGVSSWAAHNRLCPTEIIDWKGTGVIGCASNYRAGWAAQSSCDCDHSKGYANCQGFGV